MRSVHPIVAAVFAMAFIGEFASSTDFFSKREDCEIQVRETGGLPAIPQFTFEIGRGTRREVILRKIPLRPLGAPPIFEKMRAISVSGNKKLYKNPTATIEITSLKNSESATLETATGLHYLCASLAAICASGSYDSEKDQCVFPDSVVPVPAEH